MRVLRSVQGRRVAVVVALVFGGMVQFAVPAGASGGATWSSPVSLAGASTVTLGSARTTNPFMSCTSPGNCSAAGIYNDNNYHTRSYLDTEVAGTWQDAVNVQGVAAGATNVQVNGLSCGAAGDCVAFGSYLSPAAANSFFGVGTPFLDVEVGHVWQPAINVPGLSLLDLHNLSAVNVVTCTSVGNCAVAGSYYANNTYPTFVVNEVNGVWSNARELSGLAAIGLSSADKVEAIPSALTCVSSGDCVLGGYLASNSASSAFMAEEVAGVWEPASLVAGLAALDSSSGGSVSAVACSSAGNCAIGGTYDDLNGAPQAFIADQSGGTWTSAVEVPGSGALNTGGGENDGSGTTFGASVQTLSCPADGSCTMVGWYETLAGASDLFVDSRSGGTWATATALPNLANLNTGATIANNGAAASGLVCPSVGNCVIAGNYIDSANEGQIFTATEVSGSFGPAVELPGSSTLSPSGFAFPFSTNVNSLSCWDTSDCALSGAAGLGGFIDFETAGTWATPSGFVTSPTVYVGTNAEVSQMSCPTTGGCAAIGTYRTADGQEALFFAQQSGGVWGPDINLSALATFAPTGASINSFSCSSVGRCSLIGSYVGPDQVVHLYNDVELNGTWQAPHTITGFPAFSKGPGPYFFNGPRWTDISCPSALNCVGIGYVVNNGTGTTPFVASETTGVWSVSFDVTGTSTLPDLSDLTSISCPSAGNCVATGENGSSSGPTQVYVVSEVHNVWGPAQVLPSVSALSTGTGSSKYSYVTKLDCTSVTTCGAAGWVGITKQISEPFVISEVHGVWKPATYLPGFFRLAAVVSKSEYFFISLVSLVCPSSSTCILAGTYPVGSYQSFSIEQETFVLSSTNGIWTRLSFIIGPRPTKTTTTSTTSAFAITGLACYSTTSCDAIGITSRTTITQVSPLEQDYSYSYAVARATGFGSLFSIAGNLTKPVSSPDFSTYYLNTVSCGRSGACGIGGSINDGTSSLPFVMTTS